jgi:hypothetical protein
MLVAWSVLSVSSPAETYSYPKRAPIFTMDIPDTWQVETEDNILHASPKDGSVYLGLWGVNAKSMDQALEGLDEEVGKWITDLESGDAEETKINGIPFVFVDGEGKDKDDGSVVKCSVAVFIPAENEIMILIYFGTPDAEAKHEKALKKIVQSIAPAGEAAESDDGSLADQTWSGADSDGDFCRFTFEEDGTLAYEVPSGTYRNGTWIQFNHAVYFETSERHSEFLGEIDGSTMEGVAWNAKGHTWQWRVTRANEQR